MRPPLFPVLAILLSPLAAQAQTAPAAPAACAEMDQQLPPALLAWSSRGALTAATSASGLDKAVLAPGQAYIVTLAQASELTYVVQPGKPGAPTSTGGIFVVDIPKAGSYVVALGAAAWIDVLRGHTVQRSVGHGHGPACTTLRKMVTFDLQPGRYVVQIAGASSDTLPIMVAAKP